MPVSRWYLPLLAAFLGGLVVYLWVASSGPENPATPLIVQQAIERGYVQCESESSPGPCFWDATVQGNKQGRSFVITDDGEVFFE